MDGNEELVRLAETRISESLRDYRKRVNRYRRALRLNTWLEGFFRLQQFSVFLFAFVGQELFKHPSSRIAVFAFSIYFYWLLVKAIWPYGEKCSVQFFSDEELEFRKCDAAHHRRLWMRAVSDHERLKGGKPAGQH